MKPEGKELPVNNNWPLPQTEVSYTTNEKTSLDINNKLNMLKRPSQTTESIMASTEKQKEAEAGQSNCDYCDFEAAISATGYGKYNLLLMMATFPGFISCINATSTISLILPSAECYLNLNNFDKGMLNAITYVGMIASAFFWGFMSDTLGRRKLLMVGFAIDAFFSLLAGVAQDFMLLLLSKLASGFVSSGPYVILMTYLAECHSAKHRASMLVWTGIFTSTATAGLPVLAWLIIPQPIHVDVFDGFLSLPSWRIFLIVNALPSIVGSLIFCCYDESPKFLMFQGRREEAMEVFKKIYAMNTGKPKDTYPIKSLIDETKTEKEKKIEPETEKPSAGGFLKAGWKQIVPLFKPPHIKYALIIFIIQFGGLYGLNTLRLWSPQLFSSIIDSEKQTATGIEISNVCQLLKPSANSTNSTISTISMTAEAILLEPIPCADRIVEDRVYINSMIVGIATGIGYGASGYLVRALGKKWLIIACYCISAICSSAMYWATSSDMMLGLFSVYITLTSITSTTLISVVVDLFPTALRSMTVSLTMMTGRIGAMLGNLVFPLLLDWNCTVPFFLLSCVLLVTAALTLLLPKTKGKALE